jgi:CRP-like cAMP-binding protein
MNALVVLLKPHVAIPGEYVIREGDLGHEMYFIKRGTLDVVSEEDDVVFGQLKEDQYFGEIALFAYLSNKPDRIVQI